MKRCPQCEFIYEDDQSLCDMDGIALVKSPEALILTRIAALETVRPAAKSTKSRAWRFLLTAVASIVLGLVLILVYSVSTQLERARMRVASSSPAQVTADLRVPGVDSTSGRSLAQPLDSSPPVEPPRSPEVRELAAQEQVAIAAAVAKPAPSVSQTLNPGLEGKSKPTSFSPKPRSMNQKAAENTNPKKGSTIGSILRKAGRILKKPFTR
jgi:hypothetical protein